MFKHLAVNDNIEAVDEFGVWSCARIVSMSSEGAMSRAVLRLKNNEARPKFIGSYKKKCVAELRRIFPRHHAHVFCWRIVIF